MPIAAPRRPRAPQAPAATTLQELAAGVPGRKLNPVAEPRPVASPVAEPQPAIGLHEASTPPEPPQTSEIAQVTTRYTHPVYIASQHKLVHPGEICPVIVDGWVKHQLEHQQGSLIRS